MLCYNYVMTRVNIKTRPSEFFNITLKVLMFVDSLMSCAFEFHNSGAAKRIELCSKL